MTKSTETKPFQLILGGIALNVIGGFLNEQWLCK